MGLQIMHSLSKGLKHSVKNGCNICLLKDAAWWLLNNNIHDIGMVDFCVYSALQNFFDFLRFKSERKTIPLI